MSDARRGMGWKDGILTAPTTAANQRDARTLAIVLAALTLWRLATAGLTGLGDAEAYYWVSSEFPSASYFDHPPAIGWLIHATTTLFGDTSFAVRLGPILLFPATTYLLFCLGRDLFGPRASLLGCLALIATPVYHIGGVAAAPDAPLALFWALALYALYRGVTREQPFWIYTFGAAVGLGFLSKYFAVLLPAAGLLFLMRREHRAWLRRPAPWVAAGLALLAASPVIYWNAQHDFASFRFHLITRHQAAALAWDKVGVLAAGQIAYVSPLLFAGYVWALITAVGRRRDRAWGYVAAMSIPILIFFSALTLWTPEAEPHWPVLGYLPACLAFGCLVDERIRKGGEAARRMRRFFAVAIGLPVVLLAILYVHLLTPGLLQLVPERWYRAEVDLANELRAWPEAGAALRAELAAMPEGTVVLAYHYTMCSQAAFALDDPGLVRCLNTRLDAFDFFGLGEVASRPDAVYIRDNRYDRPPEEVYRFERAEPGPVVTITRAGRRVRTFQLTRLHGVHGLVPGVAGL